MIDFGRMRYLIQRIPSAYFRVEQAYDRATKITPTLSDMPHGSGVSSKVEDGVVAMEQARAACQKYIDELKAMQNELIPLMELLDDPMLKLVLQLRYIGQHSAEEVAEMVFVSTRHCIRLIHQGERNIKKMSQNVTDCH